MTAPLAASTPGENTAGCVKHGWRSLVPYVQIARPGHYWKNFLCLVGAGIAFLQYPESAIVPSPLVILLSLSAVGSITSSYYILNELLDAPSDRFHPRKRNRPLASKQASTMLASFFCGILAAVGIGLAAAVNHSFLMAASGLLLMSVLYNTPPIRLKDLPYVDVLSESLNSPLRILLGWFIVLPLSFPSATLLLFFWMAGAFLMAGKRLRELAGFQEPSEAASYRRSFAYYSPLDLRVSMFAYAFAMLIFGLGTVMNSW